MFTHSQWDNALITISAIIYELTIIIVSNETNSISPVCNIVIHFDRIFFLIYMQDLHMFCNISTIRSFFQTYYVVLILNNHNTKVYNNVILISACFCQ